MYKLVTSIEIQMAFPGTIIVSVILVKSVASFRYDFCLCAMG